MTTRPTTSRRTRASTRAPSRGRRPAAPRRTCRASSTTTTRAAARCRTPDPGLDERSRPMTDDTPGADFIDEADRRNALPEHERDDATSAGDGVTSSGEGAANDADDPTVATPMVAGTPAITGAQPMAPVYVEETTEEGALADQEERRD